ncbi:MAG: hypothetical protein AB7F83_02310, partial [Lysobacterales bacterium]
MVDALRLSTLLASSGSVVVPALRQAQDKPSFGRAGTQGFWHFRRIQDWAPAFAGATVLSVFC